MKSSVKFRIHMGCGEPLQSRRWVAYPVLAQAFSVCSTKSKSASVRRSRLRPGAKSKS